MDIILKRRSQGTAPNQQSALSAKTFLGTYVDSKSLLDFVDRARIEDIEELQRFFYLVSEGRKFSISKRTRTDAGDRRYTYQNFHSTKGSEGVKVCSIGNIEKFISDYHVGKVTIDFDLEQLVAEAEADN